MTVYWQADGLYAWSPVPPDHAQGKFGRKIQKPVASLGRTSFEHSVQQFQEMRRYQNSSFSFLRLTTGRNRQTRYVW